MKKHTTLDFYLKKNERNKIPLFAQLIFMDEDYADVEKIKFRNQFLNKYLNNSTFRKQVQGYYLYFYNNDNLCGRTNANANANAKDDFKN